MDVQCQVESERRGKKVLRQPGQPRWSRRVWLRPYTLAKQLHQRIRPCGTMGAWLRKAAASAVIAGGCGMTTDQLRRVSHCCSVPVCWLTSVGTQCYDRRSRLGQRRRVWEVDRSRQAASGRVTMHSTCPLSGVSTGGMAGVAMPPLGVHVCCMCAARGRWAAAKQPGGLHCRASAGTHATAARACSGRTWCRCCCGRHQVHASTWPSPGVVGLAETDSLTNWQASSHMGALCGCRGAPAHGMRR